MVMAEFPPPFMHGAAAQTYAAACRHSQLTSVTHVPTAQKWQPRGL
jgi:hypothetical protein